MVGRSPARANPARGARSTSHSPHPGTKTERAVATDTSRPTPEQFLSMLREQQRGRLKVYLGFAPGVGKTYEMLQEGHRLRQAGVEVVVGGDPVPRRKVEYRGVVLEEMDLDAVLKRRPTVALVDELAHTNAPGGRHGKRYQDVEGLLRNGVTVITTMNVQHLESLYEMVDRFTGVRVK